MTKNFHLSEFKCKCGCGTNLVNTALLVALQKVRDELGKPISISSGYRCSAHNKKVGGTPDSSHVQGFAADIVIPNSSYAYSIMRALFAADNFDRIGFGKVDDELILHVDMDSSKIPNLLWGY